MGVSDPGVTGSTGRRCRVLIVILLMLLISSGTRPDLIGAEKIKIKTESAEQGLVMAHHEKPDLIICDVQLPGRDGCSFARHIKTSDSLRALPLVAVRATVHSKWPQINTDSSRRAGSFVRASQPLLALWAHRMLRPFMVAHCGAPASAPYFRRVICAAFINSPFLHVGCPILESQTTESKQIATELSSFPRREWEWSHNLTRTLNRPGIASRIKEGIKITMKIMIKNRMKVTPSSGSAAACRVRRR